MKKDTISNPAFARRVHRSAPKTQRRRNISKATKDFTKQRSRDRPRLINKQLLNCGKEVLARQLLDLLKSTNRLLQRQNDYLQRDFLQNLSNRRTLISPHFGRGNCLSFNAKTIKSCWKSLS